LDLSQKTTAIVTVILAISQLTNIKFPHLVRVVKWRLFTLPFAMIYTLNLFVLSWNYSNETGINYSTLSLVIMIAFPIYIGLISIKRTLFTESEES
jgi:hypothetical protein